MNFIYAYCQFTIDEACDDHGRMPSVAFSTIEAAVRHAAGIANSEIAEFNDHESAAELLQVDADAQVAEALASFRDGKELFVIEVEAVGSFFIVSKTELRS